MNHAHIMDCKEMLNAINVYIDGDLGKEHCHDIETHLSDCHNCTMVVNTLKKTIHLFQMDGKEITLPMEAHQRLFARLDLEEPTNTDA